MSHLGDLIINDGPYYAAQLNPITAPTSEQLNELREELIELRAFRDQMSRAPLGSSDLFGTPDRLPTGEPRNPHPRPEPSP